MIYQKFRGDQLYRIDLRQGKYFNVTTNEVIGSLADLKEYRKNNVRCRIVMLKFDYTREKPLGCIATNTKERKELIGDRPDDKDEDVTATSCVADGGTIILRYLGILKKNCSFDEGRREVPVCDAIGYQRIEDLGAWLMKKEVLLIPLSKWKYVKGRHKHIFSLNSIVVCEVSYSKKGVTKDAYRHVGIFFGKENMFADNKEERTLEEGDHLCDEKLQKLMQLMWGKHLTLKILRIHLVVRDGNELVIPEEVVRYLCLRDIPSTHFSKLLPRDLGKDSWEVLRDNEVGKQIKNDKDQNMRENQSVKRRSNKNQNKKLENMMEIVENRDASTAWEYQGNVDNQLTTEQMVGRVQAGDFVGTQQAKIQTVRGENPKEKEPVRTQDDSSNNQVQYLIRDSTNNVDDNNRNHNHNHNHNQTALRLDKVFRDTHGISVKMAKKLIREGKVTVNGIRNTEPGYKVVPYKDIVLLDLDGTTIEAWEKTIDNDEQQQQQNQSPNKKTKNNSSCTAIKG
mmetsp:Transcript_2557/g.2834  ORF Transcript_2557/g.2834 Transcript_2557/m.2834 type:complete len:510 (-) Transcript_2557:90-1619(-)